MGRKLWVEWWRCVTELRPAVTRERTFLWMTVILAAMSVRSDLAGVSSFVRAGWLVDGAYWCLLRAFHSTGISLDGLTIVWCNLALTLFQKKVVRYGGRIVLIADGIKVPKEGRKMPGVKLLHQESSSNSKPEYIMGHSCQGATLLVQSGKDSYFAVPLTARIHEGLVFSNRCRKTLLDRLIDLLLGLQIQEPFYLLADAYYTAGKIADGLLAKGNHLISRARSNAVAHRPVSHDGPPKRGRPRMYGEKVKLKSLFNTAEFIEAPSPLPDEQRIVVRYFSIDLMWRPIGALVRFVLVHHPVRGRFILLSTDIALEPLDIYRLYALRFRIEMTFKQLLNTVGAWAYRFWMKAWVRTRRGDGDKFLHHTSERYRAGVRRKLNAYQLHIQFGFIALGLLQHLASSSPRLAWNSFGSWLRTMNTHLPPSEAVVATALRNSLPDFLGNLPRHHILKKFLRGKIDFSRAPEFRLAA